MPEPVIARVEVGRLEGRRPRVAGCNARLGEHGIVVQPRLARLTTSDGATGFGACHASREQAEALLHRPLAALFDPQSGVAEDAFPFEFPIWDLMGRLAGEPTHRLTARVNGREPQSGLRVPCYDTSLYFDDLHLAEDAAAVALMVAEARDGYDRGHRAFKIKVGRGARHMEPKAGIRRDIAIVRALRDAVGPDCPLMLDANNGYTLNLTKRVLAETADCRIQWMEEAFHEDEVLYRDLKEWMGREGLSVLIADGEGEASPSLLRWAREGLVDVIQYDIMGHGLTRWLRTGRALDEAGVKSAPHHYGGHYGNYSACHLAPAVAGFTFVEWDEATSPGLNGSGYAIEDGMVSVPDAPGFGLNLEEPAFQAAVQANGFTLTS